MPLYVQIIYRREVRKMALPYQLSEEEWDGGREEINIPGESTSERSKELYAIREQFARRLPDSPVRNLFEGEKGFLYSG